MSVSIVLFVLSFSCLLWAELLDVSKNKDALKKRYFLNTLFVAFLIFALVSLFI